MEHEHLDGVVALQGRLLIDGNLDRPVLESRNDVLAEVEGREEILSAGALAAELLEKGIGSGGPERQYGLSVRMAV